MVFSDKGEVLIAHEPPFKFYVHPDSSGDPYYKCLVVWRYGNETGSLNFLNREDAISRCYQFALTQTLSQLKRVARPTEKE